MRPGRSLAAVVLLVVLATACTADPTGQDVAQPASPAEPSETVVEPSDEPSVEPSASPSPSASPEPQPTEAPTPEPAPPAPFADLEGLAEGASGEPVNRLQQRLTDLGYRTGGVDGAFGPMTALAVRVFQHDHQLPPSSVVDAASAAALGTATPAEVLQPGSSGDAVVRLQQQLNDAWPFDAGTPDGQYGTRTTQAVYSLQKLHGYRADGSFGPIERYFMATGEGRIGRLSDSNSGKVVEIDLGAQLVSVYDNGQLVLASHTSTGSGETFCTPEGGCRRAVTPTGSYTIGRRIDGWRTSELGELYNPLYFNGGIALHGSGSVPTHPASHGCVRLPMHIAEYAPDMLPNGTPVIVG